MHMYAFAFSHIHFDKISTVPLLSQVVAIINAYCWQYNSPQHVNCTNHSYEGRYIKNMSRRLRLECPGVLTQMYLNSMMNFW